MKSRRNPRSLSLVLTALDDLEQPTATEIHSWISKYNSDNKLGLTSVYRALKVLTERGELRTLPFVQGEARYEKSDKDIQYFSCLICKQQLILEHTRVQVHLEDKLTILNYCLALFGYCKQCEPRRRYGPGLTFRN